MTAKCARCGKLNEPNTPEEEAAALAEYESFFGKFRQEEVVKICDDCFNLMHPDKHPHLVEDAMAEHARKRIQK